LQNSTLVESGEARRFSYGQDWLVEEHVFAPAVSGKSEWIVGTALNMKHRQTVVPCFLRRRSPMALWRKPRCRMRFPWDCMAALFQKAARDGKVLKDLGCTTL